MERHSRSPGSSNRPRRDSRERRPEYGRERDRDNRDKGKSYGDSRDPSRHEGRQRDRRNDDRDQYRNRDEGWGGSRGGRNRNSDRARDGDRERERERDRERDTRREPEWGNRAGGSSRRSASPRRSRGTSRSRGSRSRSPEDKAKPNFNPSGLLAAETKTVKNGDGTKTVLKYHEPPEARKPLVGWRLYVFKADNQSDVLHINRQSAYLFGRDKTVVDVILEHPSCSKQHAVIQFRQVREKNEYGEVKASVKPFIIDLESTNGTHVNGEIIPTSRYYELKLSDIIKFGDSLREYVLLSEDAA